MSLPRAPLAVVFDMDGLLFDTETLSRDAIMAAAADRGCEMPLDLFNQMIGCPWPSNRALLLARYGSAFMADEFRSTWMHHFQRLVETGPLLKPGALELLETLDELRLPRAIATSSHRDSVEQHLLSHDLASRFHAIVAHGDYAAGKPEPDPFLRAAERLGIAPHSCLALEDSYNGVRAASAAGMTTVMVPDLLQPTSEIRELCTLIVADLHEVRRLILAAP